MQYQFSFGNLLTVSIAFTSAAGALQDPDAVNLSVRNTTGLTTYVYGVGNVIQKTSTGKYYANLSLVVDGPWAARFWSTGNGQASDEIQFQVTPVQAA